jgi:LysM repeat protein
MNGGKISGVAFFVFSLMLLFNTTTTFAQLTDKDTANVQFINARKFFIYKVSKGETLFSISQKFKIPQEEILEFNKDVEKDGLKKNMKIWVPAYSWQKKDSVTTITVTPHYLESYKILVVTSLQLPKVYTGRDTSGIEEPFNRDLRENMEFVEGVMAGSETFRNKYKIHIYIIDDENDSVKLGIKLRRHKDSNMIITNESGSLLKNISAFSALMNIRMLSCGINTYEMIKSNSNAYAMIPSASTQCVLAGVFASNYFNKPGAIAIRTAAWKENERSNLFCDGVEKKSDKKCRKPDYAKNGATSVSDSLFRNEKNVVFIPSSNEEIVSLVLTALKEKSTEYRVSVIGLPTWKEFETVDLKLLELCNVHLFSAGLIDYNSEVVNNFRKLFRDKYNCEPLDPAYQGYDASIVANALFQQSGTAIAPTDNKVVSGIFSSYKFERSDSVSCFENKVIHVYEPLKDGFTDLAKTVKFD